MAKSPKYTRRHYEVKAELIRACLDGPRRAEALTIARESVAEYSQDNPRFDDKRFLAACGLWREVWLVHDLGQVDPSDYFSRHEYQVYSSESKRVFGHYLNTVTAQETADTLNVELALMGRDETGATITK